MPVRVAVSIIRLIRKLLDVLGVVEASESIKALSVSNVTERALLELQASTSRAEPPPSYEDATKLAAVPPRKRPRWTLPRLRTRTNDKDVAAVSETESVGSRSRASSIGSDAPVAGPSSPKSPVTATEHPAAKPPVSTALKVLQRPKVLVLDLDETLIHSTSRAGGLPALNRHWWGRKRLDYRRIDVVVDNRVVVYTVYQRPYVDVFLRKASAWYTIVVFTASLREYADPVIDWLDNGRGIFARRLFRESCVLENGNYVKDLSVIDGDLSRIILVDNSPSSYKLNQANGMPIEGFVDDVNDEALLDLVRAVGWRSR